MRGRLHRYSCRVSPAAGASAAAAADGLHLLLQTSLSNRWGFPPWEGQDAGISSEQTPNSYLAVREYLVVLDAMRRPPLAGRAARTEERSHVKARLCRVLRVTDPDRAGAARQAAALHAGVSL
jgi:hypothetical protein